MQKLGDRRSGNHNCSSECEQWYSQKKNLSKLSKPPATINAGEQLLCYNVLSPTASSLHMLGYSAVGIPHQTFQPSEFPIAHYCCSLCCYKQCSKFKAQAAACLQANQLQDTLLGDKLQEEQGKKADLQTHASPSEWMRGAVTVHELQNHSLMPLTNSQAADAHCIPPMYDTGFWPTLSWMLIGSVCPFIR